MSLISKTMVEHYYKSHDNRHTDRGLISKTMVEHYYKSHENSHTVLIPKQLSNILLQCTQQQTHSGLNCKTAVKHYYNHTTTDTQLGVLFPRLWTNIITNHTTDTQESYFQDDGRTLLQITRQQTHRSLISKTAVEHYYKSHDNRHTDRSLISKTPVEHCYKSHDNRHTGVLFPRRCSNIITNHTTTDTQLGVLFTRRRSNTILVRIHTQKG